MYKYTLLILIVVTINTAVAQQDSLYKDKTDILENFIKKSMETDKIPGMSVAFMKNDFIYVKGFGYADLENEVEATEFSSFRLGPVTQTMTAVAILQLYEKGQIDLDEDVRTYVPYYPEKAYPVTIRHLLGHLSGIPHYPDPYEEKHFKYTKGTRESIDVFADFKLIHKPGTKFTFSSYGYNLLGAVIESVSGMSYSQYMHKNIWNFLYMQDSGIDNPNRIIPRRVRGYKLDNRIIQNSEFVNISSRFASEGVRSNVVDLIKFINGLRYNRILKPETIDLMFKSRTTEDGVYTDYGMGWWISPVNGHFRVQHNGTIPEASTALVYYPRDNFAIAIACNLENTDLNPYIDMIHNVVLEEKYRLKPLVKNKTDYIFYSSLEKVFNYGFSDYAYNNFKSGIKNDKIKSAFSYFNACLDTADISAHYSDILNKQQKGYNNSTNAPLRDVGKYIASQLKISANEKDRIQYYRQGPLSFFLDYIRFYEQQPNWPQFMKFDNHTEKKIKNWHNEWMKILSDDFVKNSHVSVAMELPDLNKNLNRIDNKYKMMPDYSYHILQMTRQFMFGNIEASALSMSTIGTYIYSESATYNASIAIAFSWFDGAVILQEYYPKTEKYDYGNIYDVEWFSAIIPKFRQRANKYMALHYCEELIKIFPRETQLYYEKAMCLLALDMTKQARFTFKKVLNMDSGFKPAGIMLEKMQNREIRDFK